MADETEITGSHQAPPPPATRPPPPAGPPPPPAGPPPAPPPGLIRDVGPWLALLGLLAAAGLLVWLFVLRDRHHQHVVPAVVGLQRGPAIRRLTKDGYPVTAILGPSAKPSGIVVSQKPGGGGRTASDARAALLAAKLTVRTQYRSAAKKDAGNVLAQSPSGGTVPAYTQVTITVGR